MDRLNMSSKAQEFQDLLITYIGKLFLEDLASDRDALETAAVETACVCRHYDLADSLHERSDEDLLAIVTKADPCEICGE
jgi:hypothetical protein